MLKTFVLIIIIIIIFCINFEKCSEDSQINRTFKRTAFFKHQNVFSVSFDQLNASLLNKSVNLFPK